MKNAFLTIGIAFGLQFGLASIGHATSTASPVGGPANCASLWQPSTATPVSQKLEETMKHMASIGIPIDGQTTHVFGVMFKAPEARQEDSTPSQHETPIDHRRRLIDKQRAKVQIATEQLTQWIQSTAVPINVKQGPRTLSMWVIETDLTSLSQLLTAAESGHIPQIISVVVDTLITPTLK